MAESYDSLHPGGGLSPWTRKSISDPAMPLRPSSNPSIGVLAGLRKIGTRQGATSLEPISGWLCTEMAIDR